MSAVFWLCAMVVFLIVEAATPMLISIWFAVGSLIAGICSYAGLGDSACMLIFATVSAVSIVVFKKFYGDKFAPRHEKTNADRLIGAKGVVENDIDPIKGQGTVLVGGNLWSAKAEYSVPSGAKVEVLAIEGVKLVVKKVEV